MELPKFNETFIPILEVLRSGEIFSHRQLLKAVEERYYANLPEELLSQQTKSGDRLIENRIAWGKSYLKKGGLVHYPKRGTVQITDKGRAVCKNDVTLKNMQSDVVGFYAPEASKEAPGIANASSPQDLIDSGIQQLELQVKDDLLERLKDIDPYYFERIILILLKRMGYGEFVETSKSRDGGVDGVINEDQLGLEKIYIQAKRYRDNKVRETDIRNFIGAMSGDTQKGVFVTTSRFDDSAIRKAREANHAIVLVDGPRLIDLMYQYGIGVQVRNQYEVKVLDEDFFDGN